MSEYKTISGYSGSELERAAMAGCDFPRESTLERVVKQQVARGLIRLANYLAPAASLHVDTHDMRECC